MKNILLVSISTLLSLASINIYAQNNVNTTATTVSSSSASVDVSNSTTNKINLVLKNHVFTPNVINVKAGQKYTLVIENKDETAEEFDSSDLKVEQFVQPNKSIILEIGPLVAGSYEFEGEMHASAKGVIVAK